MSYHGQRKKTRTNTIQSVATAQITSRYQYELTTMITSDANKTTNLMLNVFSISAYALNRIQNHVNVRPSSVCGQEAPYFAKTMLIVCAKLGTAVSDSITSDQTA